MKMNRVARWSLYSLGALFVVVILIVGAEMLIVRAVFARMRPETQAPAPAIILGATGHRIAGRIFITGTPAAELPLVIVLHGDAPTRNPGYQYAFASRLAAAAPGVRVIALLRPGYSDPFGLKSDGDRGFSAGENYTADVIGVIAEAISSLKQQFHAASVILVGHSGGAAIAADIAAHGREHLEAVFLISCPCDVAPFRRHMAALMHDPMFWLPSNSLSPLATLSHVPAATTLTAITGEDDPIALPQYAREYITAARTRGLRASLTLIPKLGHEILEEDAVLEAVSTAVRADNSPATSREASDATQAN